MKERSGHAGATRKAPVPADGHADIDAWLGRQMPDLQPIVRALDASIRAAVPGLRRAVKWQKAYYGTADLGWIIELVAYDVSVNVVFLAGGDFPDPPPSGTGRSRYVKVRSREEADAPAVRRWIEQAAGVPGWSWSAGSD